MNNLELPYAKVENHPYEKERLTALEKLQLLDTLPEEDYDDLTRMAAQICGTPLSFINLIGKDRQWAKSAHGANLGDTPRDLAFCSHTILETDSMLIVENTEKDERFKGHPFVKDNPNIRFYAGAKLQMDNELPLGALCVVDIQPRKLTPQQKQALQAISNQVVQLFKLRQKTLDFEQTIKELRQKNELLQNFAQVAAHDIKSPLNNVLTLTRLIGSKYKSGMDSEGQHICDLIMVSAENLKKLINGVLEYSISEDMVSSGVFEFEVDEFFNDIHHYFERDSTLKITWNTNLNFLNTNRTVVEQILLNLISNAVKHGDKEVTEVAIELKEKDHHYQFFVCDNGPGIPAEYQDKVFDIFRSFAPVTSNGEKSHGIGLATVKKLTELLGGKVEIYKSNEQGTCIHFCLNKQARSITGR